MNGRPERRGDAWWREQPDGSWLRWDPTTEAWLAQTSPPPPPGPAGVDVAGHGLAKWAPRLGAFLLDLVVFHAPVWIVTGVVVARTGEDRLRFDGGDAYVERVPTEIGWTFIVLATLAGLVYSVALHGRRSGQTVGKRIVRIRVVDERSGASIGYARAFLRWLVTAVFTVLFFVPWIVDHLWPLWDGRRQALHDKVAGSVVVAIPVATPAPWSHPASVGAHPISWSAASAQAWPAPAPRPPSPPGPPPPPSPPAPPA